MASGDCAEVNNMCAKPKLMTGEPKFFICRNCGNLMIQVMKEDSNANLSCCDESMEELLVNIADASNEEHIGEVTLTGDFNINTITAKIGRGKHPSTAEHHIEWVYLRTFQGGQFKVLPSTRYPEVKFALAEDDAHRYCDIPVCKTGKGCNFNCKRGFFLYVYCNLHGMWRTKLLR